ncbi:hypothetical protein CLOSTMETH_01031 [[Clostridium] methylpentosum DSM 5476]|uniref:Uncharacterized protein n=1 Tax=[Clostridium] methylpentosum DSM 5476 TaxID=537013 RepID=C0EB14_9FIRM|nr:hypothetical protein CLOSTMETH_01031 [[Clostridium] methylpentosum DSM 5476]
MTSFYRKQLKKYILLKNMRKRTRFQTKIHVLNCLTKKGNSPIIIQYTKRGR